jgi:hypothetical protein
MTNMTDLVITGIKFNTWEPEWLEQSLVFAQNSYSEMYKTPRNRQIQQNRMAKLAEIAVHKIFSTTYPDFNLYKGPEKSWAPDLFLGKYNIHVKSQEIETAAKCGISWLFQKDYSQNRVDAVVTSAKQADLTAVVLMDACTSTALIMGIVPVLSVVSLFREPQVEKLRDKKLALYYSDMEKLSSLWHLEPPAEYSLTRFRLRQEL